MPQDLRVSLIPPTVTTMNAQDDPALLADTEVQTLENFDLENGLLRTRRGNITSATTATLGGSASAVGQALQSVVLGGNAYLIAIIGGKIFYSLNPNETGATWTQIPGPPTSPALSTTRPVAVEGTGDMVVFQDGVNPPIYWDGTNLGIIEHVLPPRIGNETHVYRLWPKEFVPCVGTFAGPYPQYYYIQEWHWSDAPSWTTVNASSSVVITITDGQTVTLSLSGSEAGKASQYANAFRAGTLVGLKDASKYIRASVATATATNQNLCTLGFQQGVFSEHYPSFPRNVTHYIRRKGLGGPLANEGKFYMERRPWDWKLVSDPTKNITRVNETTFDTNQNLTSVLTPGLFIRVTATKANEQKQFSGHVASAAWNGTDTRVRLVQPVVPPLSLGPWKCKIEVPQGGSTSDFPSLNLVITPDATPGQIVEVYTGLDDRSGGSYDHTMDLTRSYELAFNVLQEGMSFVSSYVKLGIGKASGDEIEFGSFDEAANWLYVGLRRKQSDGAPILDSEKDAIAYLRFTVVAAPTRDTGPVHVPFYGFRGTGTTPGSAEYAFRLTRYNQPETKILARSRYVQNTMTSHHMWDDPIFLRPPESDPNVHYEYTFLLKERTPKDGMQVFRRDAPLADYRLVDLRHGSNTFRNGLPPSELTGAPKAYRDITPADGLLAKERIGSQGEMAMPKANLMFSHQGRLVLADVMVPYEQTDGFDEQADRLRVYVSAAGNPLRFDSHTSIGDDADIKDPIFFTLTSSLPGDWVVGAVSVAGGGSGRAVLATTTRTFVLAGSHAGDFELETVGEIGAFGRRSMTAHKGVAYVIGNDRQLWAIGLAMQRIAAPKIETLLSNPYLVDQYSRGVAVEAGDNKLWISIRKEENTAYCLYGDMRPTYTGGEIAWASEPVSARWYECLRQVYPRYDNLTQLWAIEKTFGTGAAVKVVRLHADAHHANVQPVEVKSREFWTFDQPFMARKLLLMCSKQHVERNVTVTVSTERRSESFIFTVPTETGQPAHRVDLVKMLPTNALVGKVFTVEVSGNLEPLWKLYGVEMVLTPTAIAERTATNV